MKLESVSGHEMIIYPPAMTPHDLGNWIIITHGFKDILVSDDFPDFVFDGPLPIHCNVVCLQDSAVEPAGVIKFIQISAYGQNLVGENWAALRSGGPSGPGAL